MEHHGSINRWQQVALLLFCCLETRLAYYQQSCAGKTLLRSGGLSCRDRQEILDAHNLARQSVALGRVPGQPGAANMLQMVWDDELAVVAQRWADKCTLAHDGSRHVARFPVGQNIAVTWTTRTNAGSNPDFPRQIRAWFNEVRNFAFYTTGFTKGTGHYSQLVWGDTFLVGCGYSHYYDSSKGYTKLYVCNYGPGGNIVGAQPYHVGNPSCSTKGLRSSRQFQGLCEMSGYSTLGSSCKQSVSYGSYSSPSYSSTRPYTIPTQQPISTTKFRQHYYG
ncbi:venom allergen 5-like isoform X2 [Periplaneta americana]